MKEFRSGGSRVCMCLCACVGVCTTRARARRRVSHESFMHGTHTRWPGRGGERLADHILVRPHHVAPALSSHVFCGSAPVSCCTMRAVHGLTYQARSPLLSISGAHHNGLVGPRHRRGAGVAGHLLRLAEQSRAVRCCRVAVSLLVLALLSFMFLRPWWWDVGCSDLSISCCSFLLVCPSLCLCGCGFDWLFAHARACVTVASRDVTSKNNPICCGSLLPPSRASPSTGITSHHITTHDLIMHTRTHVHNRMRARTHGTSARIPTNTHTHTATSTASAAEAVSAARASPSTSSRTTTCASCAISSSTTRRRSTRCP